MKARVLVAGRGRGPLLRLTHPISFWGGVDPVKGEIVDPRHPEFGASLTGKVLAIPGAVGSSSSSAIMLELLREKTAPAAILMQKADAILALGAVVGSEIGYRPIPICELPITDLDALADGEVLEVRHDGTVRAVGAAE